MGRMFGVPGILLAIPFAAIINFIYQEVLLPRLERRRKQSISAQAAAKVQSANSAKETESE